MIRPTSQETVSALVQSLEDPDVEVRNREVMSWGTSVKTHRPRPFPYSRSYTAVPSRIASRLRGPARIGKPALQPLIEVLRNDKDPGAPSLRRVRPVTDGTAQGDRPARPDRRLARRG